MYRITAITWLYAVTTAIALVVTVTSARRRTTPSGRYLTLMTLAVTLWAGFGILEVSATTVDLKVFWSKFEYVGAAAVPVLLFLFVTSQELRGRAHSKGTIAALSVVPLVTLVVVCTNEYHSLIWTGFSRISTTTNLMEYEHGIWFWIGYVAYAYALLVIATVLLVRQVILRRALYRTQALILLVAISFPWIASIIYLAGLSPVPGLDLSRVALAVTGAVMAAGVFRWQIADLVPLARDVAIDRMADGMIVLDLEQRIIDVNAAAMALLEIEGRPPLGKHLEEVAEDCPDMELAVLPPGTAVVRCGRRWLEATVSPVDERGMKTAGCVIVLHDITERIARQEELELHRQHLEQLVEERTRELEETLADLARTNTDLALANQAKDAFLMGMSHEMRTPLNTVIGFSDVLLRDISGALNQAQSQHTRLIHDAGKQLLDFVDEAFEAAHVLSGEVVPTPARFDVAVTIREVSHAMQASADAKDLTLTVRGVADPVELINDELIVRRILGALVDRAVAVTAAGEITIELAAMPEGTRVEIVDAGPMIPEADRAALFEPFGSTRTVTGFRPDASGLSLAIAAALTAALHGTIEVDSNEGGETRLSVTLPELPTGE
ncbi:MAG: sensor histidine kinase [Coriobacteriia bacterium]